VELRGLASLPPGSGAQLRTWVSHTVPHLTLMSFTSDAIPGLNNLIALGVSVACAVVIGRALREMSASSRSSPAPADHRPAGCKTEDECPERTARASAADEDDIFGDVGIASGDEDDDYGVVLHAESDDEDAEWEMMTGHEGMRAREGGDLAASTVFFNDVRACGAPEHQEL